MPKFLGTLFGVLALFIVMAGQAMADCCNSPARVITLANAVLQQPLTPELRVQVIAWRAMAEPEAETVKATALDKLSEVESINFFDRIEEQKNLRLVAAKKLVPQLAAAGFRDAAVLLAHYIASSEACSTERRMMLLTDLQTSGSLPHEEDNHWIYRQEREQLTFTCGNMLWDKGVPPPADGSQAFWSACATMAIESAPRNNAKHFSYHHAVAEPLCGLAQPIPQLTSGMLAQLQKQR